jgi:hypothetical protein
VDGCDGDIRKGKIEDGKNIRKKGRGAGGEKIENERKTLWLLFRKRTVPAERPPLTGEVSANF